MLCSKLLWSYRKPTSFILSLTHHHYSQHWLPVALDWLVFLCCSSCRRTWRWSRWGWTLWPTWWWWWTRTAETVPPPPWRASFRWRTHIYSPHKVCVAHAHVDQTSLITQRAGEISWEVKHPNGLIFISYFKIFMEFLSLHTHWSLAPPPHSFSLSGSRLSTLWLLFLWENRLNGR